MWYSAASFGYGNPRLKGAQGSGRQAPATGLPISAFGKGRARGGNRQIERVEVRPRTGRVHFNVGGAQAIEDSLKIVRNATGKNLVFAFMGGYHGRTLGATAITRVIVTAAATATSPTARTSCRSPIVSAAPMTRSPRTAAFTASNQFAKNFETEYNSFWDAKAGESEFAAFYVEPIRTGGYVIPPPGYFPALKKVLDERRSYLWTTRSRWDFTGGKVLGHGELRR